MAERPRRDGPPGALALRVLRAEYELEQLTNATVEAVLAMAALRELPVAEPRTSEPPTICRHEDTGMCQVEREKDSPAPPPPVSRKRRRPIYRRDWTLLLKRVFALDVLPWARFIELRRP